MRLNQIKITKCEYNWDDATVDIFYSDGMKISILCKAVKTELECSPETSDKLYDIAIERPLEYAQMIFDGTIGEYCDLLDRSRHSNDDTLFHQYKKRYPDMSDEQIRSLIRESQMYDS